MSRRLRYPYGAPCSEQALFVQTKRAEALSGSRHIAAFCPDALPTPLPLIALCLAPAFRAALPLVSGSNDELSLAPESSDHHPKKFLTCVVKGSARSCLPPLPLVSSGPSHQSPRPCTHKELRTRHVVLTYRRRTSCSGCRRVSNAMLRTVKNRLEGSCCCCRTSRRRGRLRVGFLSPLHPVRPERVISPELRNNRRRTRPRAPFSVHDINGDLLRGGGKGKDAVPKQKRENRQPLSLFFSRCPAPFLLPFFAPAPYLFSHPVSSTCSLALRSSKGPALPCQAPSGCADRVGLWATWC